MKKCKECGYILPDNFKNDICGECREKMQKIMVKTIINPTLAINCTVKTCGDCQFWDDAVCRLFNTKTKECKDKACQLTNSDGDKYNDFYRCKKCLECEVCK